MLNGLYKVDFETPIGTGSGVVLLADGAIHGGDSMMYYVGTYDVSDNTFTAEVLSAQHSQHPNMQSVMGTNTSTLKLEGEIEQNTITASGTSDEAPGVTLKAVLSKILL